MGGALTPNSGSPHGDRTRSCRPSAADAMGNLPRHPARRAHRLQAGRQAADPRGRPRALARVHAGPGEGTSDCAHGAGHARRCTGAGFSTSAETSAPHDSRAVAGPLRTIVGSDPSPRHAAGKRGEVVRRRWIGARTEVVARLAPDGHELLRTYSGLADEEDLALVDRGERLGDRHGPGRPVAVNAANACDAAIGTMSRRLGAVDLEQPLRRQARAADTDASGEAANARGHELVEPQIEEGLVGIEPALERATTPDEDVVVEPREQTVFGGSHVTTSVQREA